MSRVLQDLPSDERICLPFLDSQLTGDRAAADRELAARGYSPSVVRALRAVAAVGLWYQVLDWEWGALGVYDVFLGYGPILLGIAALTALLGQFGWAALAVATALFLFGLGGAGLFLRRQARDSAG